MSRVYDCGFLEAKSLTSEDSRRVLFLGKFFEINRPIFYDFFWVLVDGGRWWRELVVFWEYFVASDW